MSVQNWGVDLSVQRAFVNVSRRLLSNSALSTNLRLLSCLNCNCAVSVSHCANAWSGVVAPYKAV